MKVFSWLRPGRVPLIVAHRGDSSSAPENTLAAFRLAVLNNADAVELDARLTRDGEAIVFHDNRLERTTNGSGFVAEKSLVELKKLSAGEWFNKKYSAEKVPTLAEVFGLVGGRAGINIEIKSEPGSLKARTLVSRCCDIVMEYRAESFVLISSFNPACIKNVKALLPSVPTGLLYHPVRHAMKSPVAMARSSGADYLIMSGAWLRKRVVFEAHRVGLLVAEYTVDTERRSVRGLRYGVDAVITNRPSKINGLIFGL